MMDRNEILELENKLLHPTTEPISLPLYFLKSITRDFCDEQELGRGGYGVVYKGILHRGDSFVAVKKIHDSLVVLHDEEFQKEAAFLMGIQHPNVIRLLGYCSESKGEMIKLPNGKVVIAEKYARMICFEYMCNGGLDKHLSDLEWRRRYEIIKEICKGLDFLHKCNIVHLDLNPQNILMDDNMKPKIADFGLSRLLGKQNSNTITVTTSDRLGTLGYMAPEYILHGKISKKADIYSLGVIIIQILKGSTEYRLPISTETDIQQFIEKMFHNWRNRFKRASKYTAELHLHTQQVKQCIKVALKCMHLDRKKRPNALDIIKILDVAESSSCLQNGDDSPVEHQMGSQKLPQDVWPEDELLALYRGVMMDNAPPARISEDMWNEEAPVVPPPQPQGEPALACAQHNEGSMATLCYQGARNASFWVAHKALASLEDNVLKDWADTINLGDNVEALEQELRSVKVILELTLGKVIHNLALEHILMGLRELVYDADEVLDEMEYFRIQSNVLGGAQSLDLNVLPSVHDEPPKLRFDRDIASRRIEHIVEQMQVIEQKVSSAIKLLGSDWSTAPNIALDRPITISKSIEPKLYGREFMIKTIIDEITKGKHSGEVLKVIPIVGPGGIGKTTLAQHIYHNGELQEHFDVRVWTCVSLNFNVKKLIEEIQRYIPKVDGERDNDTASELIRRRLENKRLLLVLDDIWDCSNEDEWKRLLLPFRKSQGQGNVIIVTTRFPAQEKIMVQRNNQPIYLQGIENKECKELFLEIVFGDDHNSRKDHEFLLETGFKIVDKLKGSPLAAKTVGRLLKTELDLDHWKRVLESKEWEHSDGKNDIMPALKLSFEYLPPQLQQCFSYCALFPQDYKFEREELINFWIGLEVLHPTHAENKRVEDVGLRRLTELVNYGLLEKEEGKDGRTCYIIHDLLHELALKVSSLECLSIDSSQSQVSSLDGLPSSIRHLSINIDVTTAKDRLTLKNYFEYFNTFGTKLKVEQLRTLIIIGEDHGFFVKAVGDLFKNAKALRLVFLSGAPYDVKHLHNFHCLIHLRYLRIESSFLYRASFLERISKLYHMKVLDVKRCNIIVPQPIDICNLVNLRHLLVQIDTTHSSITEVGKLKSLQELRRFMVKQDAQGFELRQIGHSKELYGSLCIDSLENVQLPEEADEAKLMLKCHLHELTLCWTIKRSTNVDDSALADQVLERLRPSSNLQELSIIGHGGSTCPSWLGMNLSLGTLKSMCLDNVAWKTFPPIGDLRLVNLPHEESSINIPEKRFGNLRKLELLNLSGLKKWVVHAPCQLFPYLEVLTIKFCPRLVELSFSHSACCCQQGEDATGNLFSRLSKLEIESCPQLSSFPPVPWTEALCSTSIVKTSSLGNLFCEKQNSEYSLTIEGNDDSNDSTFWNVLAFHNLTGLKELSMSSCQFLPLCYLQMLSSLRTLQMSCSSNVFPFVEADSHVKYQFPVESLVITEWNASGKELTQLLTYLPKLSHLHLQLFQCKEVTGLAVTAKGQRATETPGPSSSANINKGRLLLLPPQLQELLIHDCPKLSLLHSNPYDDDSNQYGRTGGGGGLQGLTSLRWLKIMKCPMLLSSYSSSSFSSSLPFPNSLKDLDIYGAVGMDALVPLSNLTSLTSLSLSTCGDSRGEGLLSLLAQGHLTKLSVTSMPDLFVDPEHSQVHEEETPSCSSKLQELKIDDVAGFTTASIRGSLIFSSLTKLEIYGDKKVDHFIEQQRTLLFVNSLEDVRFSIWNNLQSLPERLHGLCKLKRLRIWSCGAIQMLPKDVLPSSLEELVIWSCPKIQSLTKDCLPDSLQKLVIYGCAAIRSLPNVDDLPTSLRELDVSRSDSEELRSQCRRFINIIPIVRVDYT